MISTLRIVLAERYEIMDHPSELYAGLLALSFCDNLPTDFKGPVKGVVDKFRGRVKSGVGNAKPLDWQESGIKAMGGAVGQAWSSLEGVKMLERSKYYRNDIEYRSYLLLKAFFDEFKLITIRIGGTVPPTASLSMLVDATKELPEDTKDVKNKTLYKAARNKFGDVPVRKPKEPTEGKPGEKPTQTEGDKPAAPSKDDAKVTTPEDKKVVPEAPVEKIPGGTRLDKNIQTL